MLAEANRVPSSLESVRRLSGLLTQKGWVVAINKPDEGIGERVAEKDGPRDDFLPTRERALVPVVPPFRELPLSADQSFTLSSDLVVAAAQLQQRVVQQRLEFGEVFRPRSRPVTVSRVLRLLLYAVSKSLSSLAMPSWRA